MINSSASILFKLLRIALGNEIDFSSPNVIDWSEVIQLAAEQGLLGQAFDGLRMLRETNSGKGPDEDLYYSWLGQVMVGELDYQNHLMSIEGLARVYERAGLRMMLLKGYGLSLYWPVPEHRQVGDIDIWLINENEDENQKIPSSAESNNIPASDEGGLPAWKRGDAAVERMLGINVDNSHHHHSVFQYGGFSVENHYDFLNVHAHRSSQRIEQLLKQLATQGNHIEHTLPNGAKIYFPSPDLNALFVIRHCAAHFAAEKMTLRQLLDWALLIKTYHEDVDWSLFWNEVEKMGMLRFVLSMNIIAVQQLGFDPEVFHTPERYAGFAATEQALVDRVLGDIMHPEYDEPNGRGAIKYVYGRFRRWWHNRWKHRLVYSDSLLDTFFVQIKSHLMKPSTLVGK